MAVVMVQIRIMKMAVFFFFVGMPVAVFSISRAFGFVNMVMMEIVMRMSVLVFDKFVKMFMIVAFRKMAPYADPHKNKRDKKRKRDRLAEYGYRSGGAEKRRKRKIGASSGSPYVAERKHEKRYAQSVSEKTYGA